MIEKIFSQIRFRFFDYSSKPSATLPPTSEQLEASLKWFRNSMLPEGGSAAKYSMMTNSFTAGYPMSTASWIPTLTRVRQFYPEVFNKVFSDVSVTQELVNWVIRTQRRDGTFPGSYGDFMNQPPRVFNNGLIIRALLDYHNAYGGNDILEAARNSAEWLLKVQSGDGSWRQFTFHQLSSNTLTASALIRLGDITGDRRYKNAGEANIHFALSLQKDNGYFHGNGFDSNSNAFTLTISYALEGLLEAAILTGNDYWINSAIKGIVPILNQVRNDGYLFGELDEDFNSTSGFCCLSGNCQLAIVGYKIASLTGKKDMKEKADLLINYVRTKQMKSEVADISGGITGSWPISGNYCAYEIPSWAVRYFTEALMMQDAAI